MAAMMSTAAALRAAWAQRERVAGARVHWRPPCARCGTRWTPWRECATTTMLFRFVAVLWLLPLPPSRQRVDARMHRPVCGRDFDASAGGRNQVHGRWLSGRGVRLLVPPEHHMRLISNSRRCSCGAGHAISARRSRWCPWCAWRGTRLRALRTYMVRSAARACRRGPHSTLLDCACTASRGARDSSRPGCSKSVG